MQLLRLRDSALERLPIPACGSLNNAAKIPWSRAELRARRGKLNMSSSMTESSERRWSGSDFLRPLALAFHNRDVAIQRQTGEALNRAAGLRPLYF